eukprot:c3425_g1_i1 orf=73-426(-)
MLHETEMSPFASCQSCFLDKATYVVSISSSSSSTCFESSFISFSFPASPSHSDFTENGSPPFACLLGVDSALKPQYVLQVDQNSYHMLSNTATYHIKSSHIVSYHLNGSYMASYLLH